MGVKSLGERVIDLEYTVSRLEAALDEVAKLRIGSRTPKQYANDMRLRELGKSKREHRGI